MQQPLFLINHSRLFQVYHKISELFQQVVHYIHFLNWNMTNLSKQVLQTYAVGWNDEQYPALCGRSGVEGYSILVMLTIVYYLGKGRFRY